MVDGTPSLGDARAVLGVPRAATPAQVVAAFRHRARAVHPDVSESGDAAARFAALVAAYRVALAAARHESRRAADPATNQRAAGSSDRPRVRAHDVVSDQGGTTVWEAGRPLLHVGPVLRDDPSTRRRPPGTAAGRDTRG